MHVLPAWFGCSALEFAWENGRACLRATHPDAFAALQLEVQGAALIAVVLACGTCSADGLMQALLLAMLCLGACLKA